MQALQKQGNWRLLTLIILIVAIAGLLSPAAFLHATREKIQYQAHHQTSGVHKRITIPGTQTTTLAPRPSRSVRTSSQIADQIDSLLTQQVNNQQFSGSVLIAQNSQILLAKGYNMANRSAQTPNDTETRFYLGSVTKEFTAMALLILQEQGKLHIYDPLCSFIPNCPPPWQPLSIHELLIHTSGIPQLDDSQLSDDSPAAWIGSFDNVPLQFAPGGEFQYCSICYQILAWVVQQVSGVPYTQFVQQAILDRLDMKDSGFDPYYYYSQPDDAIGNIGWQASAEPLGIQLNAEWSFLNGSGLLYSTVDDLYRWNQALYTDTLVSQRTLNQAFTPYVTANLFPGTQYGYGWFISQSPTQGHRLLWHDGVIDGFRNYIGRYIDDNVTIILLGNLATIDIISLVHSMEQVIFGNASSN